METRQPTPYRASGDDPARFLQELRQLRNGAGLEPAELAARAHYPYDRIRAAEAGPSLPDLPVLSAYVRGCGGTTEEWEERWRSLTSAQTLPLLAARPAGTSTAASAGARIGSVSPAADTPDPSIIMAALDRVAEGMAVGSPGSLPSRSEVSPLDRRPGGPATPAGAPGIRPGLGPTPPPAAPVAPVAAPETAAPSASEPTATATAASQPSVWAPTATATTASGPSVWEPTTTTAAASEPSVWAPATSQSAWGTTTAPTAWGDEQAGTGLLGADRADTDRADTVRAGTDRAGADRAGADRAGAGASPTTYGTDAGRVPAAGAATDAGRGSTTARPTPADTAAADTAAADTATPSARGAASAAAEAAVTPALARVPSAADGLIVRGWTGPAVSRKAILAAIVVVICVFVALLIFAF